MRRRISFIGLSAHPWVTKVRCEMSPAGKNVTVPCKLADPTLRAVRDRIVGVRRRCGVLYVVRMS